MRFIILVFLIYLLYRLVRGFLGLGKKLERSEEGGTIDEMVQDPFCKIYVPIRDAKRRVIHGREYFFCSDECADKFKKQISQ